MSEVEERPGPEIRRRWERARAEIGIGILGRINAAAEADMLRGNPVTGAHHRAIEAELKRLRDILATADEPVAAPPRERAGGEEPR